MATQIEELMPLVLGKGVNMRLYIDHSEPEESPKHNWTETTYDGKEGSDFLAVLGHWHAEHDEIMEVLEGRMVFYLDGKELVTSAGDPPLVIPRRHVHGFTVIKSERVTFKESTRPAGTFKAEFFQDMFQAGSPGFLMAMRVFYDSDAFVSLPGGLKAVDYVFITIVGFIAKAFVPTKPLALKRMGDQDTSTATGGFFSK